MEITGNTSVGEIVKENFKTARIFEKNKIDFCCGGDISLDRACEKANADVKSLIPELEAQLVLGDPDSEYINSLELDELSTYIERRHHSYVTQHIPFLQQKLEKLCDVHGSNHPELFQLKELFGAAAGNLSAHMKKEELILFPMIRKMMKFKAGNPDLVVEFREFESLVESLDAEHQLEGERFEKISSLSNQYTCPPDGCNTFMVTYQTLKDFEQDLHRHIHLENNVLFKKAGNLGQEIKEKKT